MANKFCGECKLEVNDLEPVVCGFCETLFHIRPQCCGFNQRSCKDIFSQGKVLFICSECRAELNGRSIRAYMKDVQNLLSAPARTDSLEDKMQQLTGLVETLSQKVDNFVCGAVRTPPCEPITPQWPRLSVKRRRKDVDQNSLPAINRGTKCVDLSDLSVPFIVPAVSPPKFWLYLSGFQPLITVDDVQKIIFHCLELTSPAEVIRLVPRGKDVSNMTFVSFKIGLDTVLKEKALNAENWPAGIRFREFVQQSKND